MLSSLLAHADDDPQTAALLREGGEAFVSQSLRPYLRSEEHTSELQSQ